jgi:hypothetical protein
LAAEGSQPAEIVGGPWSPTVGSNETDRQTVQARGERDCPARATRACGNFDTGRSTGSDLSENLLEVVPIADRFEVGLGLEVDTIAEAFADGGSNRGDGPDQGRLDLLGMSGGNGPGDLRAARGKKNALLAVDVCAGGVAIGEFQRLGRLASMG